MIRFTFQRFADTIYLFICMFFKIMPAVILHSGDAKETPFEAQDLRREEQIK